MQSEEAKKEKEEKQEINVVFCVFIRMRKCLNSFRVRKKREECWLQSICPCLGLCERGQMPAKLLNTGSGKYCVFISSYFRFSVSMHPMIAFRQVCQSPIVIIHPPTHSYLNAEPIRARSSRRNDTKAHNKYLEETFFLLRRLHSIHFDLFCD